MAKIPVEALPSVATRPLPTPYMDAGLAKGAFGEGLAQGLHQSAANLTPMVEMLKRAQAEADAAAVAKAEAKLGDHINATLYDPEKGFLAQKGETALAQYRPAIESVVSKRNEILGGLANDDQRRVFEMRSAGTMQQMSRQVESHTSHQINLVKNEAFKAREQTGLDTISLNYSDPIIREREQQNGQAYVLAEAKRLGLDASGTARMIDEWKQKTTEAALNGYLAHRDAKGARTFFIENREALGTHANKYEPIVREAGIAQDAEDTVAVIVANRLGDNGKLDGQAVVSDVEALNVDADLKERVRQLALHQVATFRRQWEQKQKDIFNQAASDYERTKSLNQVRPEFKTWLLDPKNDAVHYWRELENWAHADMERFKSGVRKETPQQKLNQFLLEADMVDHPEKFLGMT